MTHTLDGLLLLGPTGSGKTPLGEVLEQRGRRGRRCIHFDFGENLRRLARRAAPNAIVTRDDILFVRHILRTGALLEDKDFPLAERVLRSYLANHDTSDRPLVVLNGLPRHAGQAMAIEHVIDVQEIVQLDCEPEVVYQRVQSNSGGDRGERVDDDRAAVRKKLAIYADRTAPLVEFYRQRGAKITTVPVTLHTTAIDAWQTIESLPRERP